MWKCPKCGRTFKNRGQDHYCGEAPKTIDEYISMQPEQIRPYLSEVRNAIHNAIPDAEERISWSMPTYWKQRNIIHFAGFKKHIGLYPGPEAVERFSEQLTEYKSSKGTIQFPHSKPIPVKLIADIAKWCYEAGGKSNEQKI